MFVVNRNPSAVELRKFGSAMIIGFCVIAAVLWLSAWFRGGTAALAWSGSGRQIAAIVCAVLGAALFGLSRVSLSTTKVVYVGWMSAAVPVGLFMSQVLLTILFVLLLPLFSLIVRFGDPLRRKISAQPSYWEDYKHYEPTLERMRRPF